MRSLARAGTGPVRLNETVGEDAAEDAPARTSEHTGTKMMSGRSRRCSFPLSPIPLLDGLSASVSPTRNLTQCVHITFKRPPGLPTCRWHLYGLQPPR